MSIRPLDKNKWVIDYYPLGRKGHRIRLTFNGTEAEAKIFETELRRQHAGLPNPINPKIIDIIPEYLEWLGIHRAKKTYDDIFECLKRILPHFGHLQIRMITSSIINKYKEKRIGRVCACNKELTYLSVIISWMAKHEPPYANPLPFRIEKIPYKKPLPRVPSIKDIEKFLKEIKEPIKKAMVLLMYQTGLRYSDMAFIKWENIDFNEKTIHLIQKGGSEKVIVMTDDIFNMLYPIRKTEGFVFVNSSTGKPFKSIRKMINTACEKAQVKRIRPHLLRHAFGTYALEATGDLRLVQELLGHKDIDSTQIYTHIMTSRKREGFKKVADYIGQKKIVENSGR